MKILMRDPFTQTLGASNYMVKEFDLKVNPNTEPLMSDGMKSYNQYLNYFYEGKQQGKTILKNKLENLKIRLEVEYGEHIDPVLYLANLYYGEQLSIKDVFERVKLLGMDYTNHSSIEKMFKKTFLWELRDTTGGETTRRKNKVANKIGKAKEISEERNRKKYEIIENYTKDKVGSILSTEEESVDFDVVYFNGLKKSEKITYITSLFLGIDEEDIYNINSYGPGARVISIHFNKVIEQYLKKYKLELTIFPKDIQKIIDDFKKLEK